MSYFILFVGCNAGTLISFELKGPLFQNVTIG